MARNFMSLLSGVVLFLRMQASFLIFRFSTIAATFSARNLVNNGQEILLKYCVGSETF